MTAAFVAGLLAGYGVAVPVGAIALLLMSLTARTSLRIGAAAALGVAAADGIYALVAVLGGAALARFIEPIATPLRWVAVAVLLYLAGHTAVSAIRHYRDPARAKETRLLDSPGRAFLALLGLTLLNPMTIVYFGALVLGGQAVDGLTGAQGAVFVSAAFLASASWQLSVAAGGALVGRVLGTPRGRLVTALVSSLVISVLALALVVAE
ncbi:LysE family transporter [Catellatospora bangladeshensis]|uniref:Lysine transporter LysE n=1 Tax=Catellatospora bangladeshensis TaxID=310355 RepID=A0A8J3JIF9_9ACTN|nr:LysE family transporter [Catellatospora bangladeshensis]GIF79203.1 lysine transporter LysE [Catellatospora bangladeshensis]